MSMRWYSVSVLSNFEKRVAETIKEAIVQNSLQDEIEEVLVPTEEVLEVRRGKKVQSERRFMPGYVLIRMKMTDKSYQIIKETNRGTGFLGKKGKPMTLSDDEVARILNQVEEGADRPRALVSYEVGEQVSVIDGPFEGFSGLVEEVDEALGEKLSNLIWEGDIADLTLTQNAQPALMAMSLAVLRGLESEGFDLSSCSYLAGHSLGEYSALAMSKAISVSDAARLLKARGLAMQDAVPVGKGAMAAILGLNFDTVQSLTNLAQAQAPGICQAANDNDPSQVVISGEKSAVELAIAFAKEEGAKRAIMLPVSAPFHCELMAPAAEQMKIKLDSIKIDTPIVPIVSNVSAEAISDPDTIKKLLVSQVTGSVRWRESILWMAANDVDEIWEVGSGKALSGMIRRIDKDISLKNFSSAEDIKSAVF